MATLLHGEESRDGADAGSEAAYIDTAKRSEVQAKRAQTGQTIDWHIARRRKAIRRMAKGWQKKLILAAETLKARAS